MKTVLLKHGRYALVSDRDYNLVKAFKWRDYFDGWNWYAITDVKLASGKYTNKSMHRMIMNAVGAKIIVDHRNGNGLDNRRRNIRIVTNRGNCINCRKQARKTRSKFKGVSICKDLGWKAYLRFNGKYIHLGVFASETFAAKAYDKSARLHFGTLARVNFPRQGETGALEKVR